MPDARPPIDPHAVGAAVAGEQRISADSHMAEPPDLFETRLPKELRDRALHFPKNKLYESNHHLRAGGWDPGERLRDLEVRGLWTGPTQARLKLAVLGEDWPVALLDVLGALGTATTPAATAQA